MEYVVLVDERDRETGKMEKMQAHIEGRLHRAISVFVFNSKGEFLLQRRAYTKYHSAGLWTNTCCSHPRPGEETAAAATRRLMEEMGIACPLKPIHSFIYRAEFDNGLVEHEFDHVFVGVTDMEPVLNPTEVAEWKYISRQELLADMQDHPMNYTPWFRICLNEISSFR